MMSSADALQSRRARRVAYGTVALLLVVAAVQAELWPLTAFRLFSSVRTGTGSGLELVAIAPDGVRTRVPARSQLLGRLPPASPTQAAGMVDAWLEDAGLDADDAASVVLERTTWQLDPQTLERHETGRVVVREVQP